MRTDEEKAAEIAALKALKPRIREWSSDGGNNHAAVELQINVIEHCLAEALVHDRAYGAPEEDGDQDTLLYNALEAYYWLAGVQDNAPSEGWRDIAN